MSLRKIDDEKFCRTYYIEPGYADGDEVSDRRTLASFEVAYAEEESPEGSIERLEGDASARFAPRIWELLREDESLLETVERPLSAFEQVAGSLSHLQRMRDLRRRLKIRRSLEQDVG